MTAPLHPAIPTGMQEIEVVKFDPAEPAGKRLRDVVISESLLSIQVDGTPYTLLRTPGNDRELVVGFLFTEGLIDTLDDVSLLSECPDAPDIITVGTTASKEKPRRTLVITSSCGLCGREDVEGLLGALGRIESDAQISLKRIYEAPAAVRRMQTLFGSTGSAHAAALVQPDGQVACVKEDVGRHNALDKLIGHALIHRLPMGDMAVLLSGRISLELMVKVARAGVPILMAVGAPTDAAVAAADRLGITLCGFLRGKSVSVYAHGWRVVELKGKSEE